MRSIELANKSVSDDSDAYVIAEVGHNHQGNLENAIELIRAAARSGASAVKFQKRNNKKLFTPSAYNEIYNSENAFGKTYGEHRDFLEFGETEYRKCLEEANNLGITFFSTAFDFDSADFLNNLGFPIFKIASGDLQSIPLLKHVAKFNKPMIISTGGSTFEMIELAVNEIRKFHNQVVILQCTASYPANYSELNLQVIKKLREKYPENVIGYSGHENGIAMPVVAYTLGARVIEKHFTLNRALKGTDHAFSLEPQGMQKLVRDLKRAKEAMGDGEKRILDNEKAPLRKMGKMIVAAKNLESGHTITETDLEYRSPSLGLAPSMNILLIGKTLNRNIQAFEKIQLEDLA
jgi:N-acetylneuraminate synthase/sialic acid synthase